MQTQNSGSRRYAYDVSELIFELRESYARDREMVSDLRQTSKIPRATHPGQSTTPHFRAPAPPHRTRLDRPTPEIKGHDPHRRTENGTIVTIRDPVPDFWLTIYLDAYGSRSATGRPQKMSASDLRAELRAWVSAGSFASSATAATRLKLTAWSSFPMMT